MAAPPLASLADGELHAPTLSAEEVDFFQHWGYLRLGPVAPPEHIEALRERIDDIMLGNVRYDDRMMMQLCPSASHLPQFEEFGATQSREFKGPTLNYRKIQDLDLDDVRGRLPPPRWRRQPRADQRRAEHVLQQARQRRCHDRLASSAPPCPSPRASPWR